MNELEEKCRQLLAQAGIDGRTNYFAGVVQTAPPIEHFQDLTRLPPQRIEEILRGFISERYADHFERRSHGLVADTDPLQFLLSSGYKRGLTWRGVPLGKTCWERAIYQQLIQDLQPRTVIEFGSGRGASALFFLDTCRLFGIEARVVTIDLNPRDITPKVLEEPAIEFIGGDVKNVAELLPVAKLTQLPHPWLVIEDAHVHVRTIVEHIQPQMVTGDYFVVEDLAVTAQGTKELQHALQAVPKGVFMVDTHYTDLFGRNVTCSPDAIFRKM